MITINQEKCIGCGLCADVCPATIITINEEKKAVYNGTSCMYCLHCAAICSQNAITYNEDSVVGEKVRPFTEESVEMIDLVVKQRRSYRKFKEERVDRKLVRELIAAGDLAASAKNQHPTNWIVVDDPNVIEKMSQAVLEFCKENKVSPEILAAHKKGYSPVVGHNASLLIGYCFEDAINPAYDTAIALTNIELMMQARKIGTCWGGYLARFINVIPACKELINLPEGATVYATLMFGYPNQPDYRYVPVRVKPAKIDFV